MLCASKELRATLFLMILLNVVRGVHSVTCGLGNVGTGYCSNPDKCCTSDGWCGYEFCDSASPVSPMKTPTKAPSTSPTTSTDSPVASPTAPPESSVRVLEFPAFANGDCSGLDNVMAVNVGYYQSWSIWRDPGCNPVTPEGLDVAGNGYTHVAYSFASIDANFRLEPWESNYDVEVPLYENFNALKTQYPGLKTLMAIGGWTFNNPGETEYRFSDAASTAENRATFAASCLDFCRLYNFDGIDIDWEFPGDTTHGGRAEDKVNLVLMMQAIREVFDAAGVDFVITVATPVSASRLYQGFDLAALAESVDFFHLMTYNIYTPNSQGSTIGANTDMPYIFDSVQYILNEGVLPTKIVLGLAAYGRSYVLADPTCATEGCEFVSPATGGCGGSSGFMPYFTIEEYVESGNYKSLYWNPKTGTAELYVDENLYISYDNDESYTVKYDFATQSCLRGVMWWSADMKKATPPKSGVPLGRNALRWHQWLLSGGVIAFALSSWL